MHHAAGHRPGLEDFDGVTHARQMIGGRQTAGTGADDENTLASGRCGDGELPVLLQGQITEEPFHRMNTDRGIELASVTGRFTGMVADPAVDAGHRVIFGQTLPGFLEATGLRMGQPSLDILTCWTGIIASRQQIHIKRPLHALRADIALFLRQIQRARHIDRLVSHRASLCLSSGGEKIFRPRHRNELESFQSFPSKPAARNDGTLQGRSSRYGCGSDPISGQNPSQQHLFS